METKLEFESRIFHEGYAKAAANILEQVDQAKHGWREYQPSWLVGFEKARDVVAQISRDAQQDVPSASELLYEANKELDQHITVGPARSLLLVDIHDLYVEAYNKLNQEQEARVEGKSIFATKRDGSPLLDSHGNQYKDDDIRHWNPSDPPLDENLDEEV